ncbi:leucine-rich repeat-containing protein 75B-like [Conger conger]|uniref:leucine-rich repeat-containing protein 75B-like n=1 Tax=Conger conger TaxID=82655 RepID=UPI002A599610|nr:leucine-rich repeat-containing protein 75B-like [Conger conger]
MGSRLSRRGSLDNEIIISKRRRKCVESCGEAAGSGGCVGGDFVFTSLILNSDKLPEILRKSRPNPYVQRVTWVREIQKLLREHEVERARDVLKLLRKDLGLEGTSLNDVLHRNGTSLNLVDPISHQLLLSLARDLQCPRLDPEQLKSSNKICRQLIYHLTPHSKWLQQGKAGQGGAGQGAWQGMPKRKPQACVKTALQQRPPGDTLDLSSLPLSSQDLQRLAHYLHGNSAGVTALDLSFTGLRDEQLGALLPALAALPRLAALALNGNRLTRAGARLLTEALKDPGRCPRLAWVDLGNNADICALPQPLLLALRRRLGPRSGLPAIQERRAEEEQEEEVQAEEELWDRLEVEEVSCRVEVVAQPLSITVPCCER